MTKIELDETLKNINPCPFCGHMPDLQATPREDFYFMACTNCGARTQANTAENAYEDWLFEDIYPPKLLKYINKEWA